MTEARFFVPEVLQTSLMDCGPAALKAVLSGFGIDADYDALRERCATDVDGTSMDALAALGREFGLGSQHLLLPRDGFLLRESRALPAIVVTRGALGVLHFVVVWRVVGRWVMLMDPASGRRWLPIERVLSMMPELPLPVGMQRWRAWADSPDALAPLRARLRALGIRRAGAEARIGVARRDPSWRGFGTLDAALRMTAALVRSGALRGGAEASRWLSTLTGPDADGDGIPAHFHWVTTEGAPPGKLLAKGSVVVHFTPPRRRDGATHAATNDGAAARARGVDGGVRTRDAGRVSPGTEAEASRRAAEAGPLARPGAAAPASLFVFYLRLMCGERQAALLVVALVGLVLHGVLLTGEALAMRSLLDIQRHLVRSYQVLAALTALLCFVAAALGLELWTARAVGHLARRLELRLRAAFLEKLPRLPDHYLRSRPSSDLADRGHLLHVVRQVPLLWAQAARAGSVLLATTAALVWLYPDGAALTLGLFASTLAVTFAARRVLGEPSSRVRTHASALTRFYLDALLGASPVRVHGAEMAVRSEHEQLLTHWAGALGSLHLASARVNAIQLGVGTCFGLVLVASYVFSAGTPARLLMLAYWALRVPVAASELAALQLSLRSLQPIGARLMALVQAPSALSEDGALSGDGELPVPSELEPRCAPVPGGVELRFDDVTVVAGGHVLLDSVSARIPPGSQLAIVGESGAGKSSLVALLLGWLEPARGRIEVDGWPLDRRRLAALRSQTVWVDPAVQLWDGSLCDNLLYGDDGDPEQRLPLALAGADLHDVLENLPEGMQAQLGQGGGRISGGQGQRVRLGRALMRPAVRLVILDEPFRGLEHDKRRELSQRVREHWPAATLLFVSHDVEDTTSFERVLVVRAGRIVEDDSPSVLAARPSSAYAGLLVAAQLARRELWSQQHWRRARLDAGQLQEQSCR